MEDVVPVDISDKVNDYSPTVVVPRSTMYAKSRRRRFQLQPSILVDRDLRPTDIEVPSVTEANHLQVGRRASLRLLVACAIAFILGSYGVRESNVALNGASFVFLFVCTSLRPLPLSYVDPRAVFTVHVPTQCVAGPGQRILQERCVDMATELFELKSRFDQQEKELKLAKREAESRERDFKARAVERERRGRQIFGAPYLQRHVQVVSRRYTYME